MLLMAAMLACSEPIDSVRPSPGDDTSGDDTATVEQVPGSEGCTSDALFSSTEVHHFDIELSDAAIEALAADPTTYVEGTLTW